MKRLTLTFVLAMVTGCLCIGLENRDIEAAEKPAVVVWHDFAGTGEICLDRSGNGRDAKIVGAVRASDELGECLLFDGVDDYVGLPDIPFSDFDGVTLEVVVKPEDADSEGNVFSASTNLFLVLEQKGRIRFSVRTDDRTLRSDGLQSIYAPRGLVAPGKHYHVVGTYDGQHIRLYVNGGLVARTEQVGVMRNPDKYGSRAGSGLLWPSMEWDRFFRGSIAELKVYDGAMTEEQLKAAHRRLQEAHPETVGSLAPKHLWDYVPEETDNDVCITVKPEQVSTLLGMGANVWPRDGLPGNIGFPGWPDEAKLKLLALTRWSGVKMVRFWFRFPNWEPSNDDDDPFHYNWSGFSFDTPVTKGYYSLLDFCEKNGIDVEVDTAQREPFGGWLGRITKQETRREEYMEAVAALIRHLRVVKEYKCIKYVAIGNEPVLKTKKAREAFFAQYPILDRRLRDLGLRDNVKIMGPETTDYGSTKALSAYIEHFASSGKVIDVASTHDYGSFTEHVRQAMSRTTMTDGVEAYRTYKKEMSELYGYDFPLVIGEFGNAGNGSKLVTGEAENFVGSLSLGEFVLRGMNAGVNGFLRWERYRVPCNFASLTWDEQSAIKPYRPVYFPYALLCRWVGNGWRILRTETNGGKDTSGIQRVWAASLTGPKGELTVLLINNGRKPKRVTLSLPVAVDKMCWLSYDATLPETIQRGDDLAAPGKTCVLTLKPQSLNALTTVQEGTSLEELREPLEYEMKRTEPRFSTVEADGRTCGRVQFGFEHPLMWDYWRQMEGPKDVGTCKEPVHSGKACLKLLYELSPAMKGPFLVGTWVHIPGPVRKISVWVHGDGSGTQACLAFRDSSPANVFKVPLAVVDWKGWRLVEKEAKDFPSGLEHFKNPANYRYRSDGVIEYPLTRVWLGLTTPQPDFSGSVRILFDDLEILCQE